MATETTSMPNGNYGSYGGHEQNSSGYAPPNGNTPSSYNANSAPSAAPTSNNPGTSEIPKDEVGWYFVEQYYTTLSRSPEKLYLFYNKRSQFVLGQEADKVAVCVGQKAINEHIKELDFRDCKVRVTNVDSQASDTNIVIQVIGEMSNKSQPHKKFTQTFVLAGQTNGYFVLNDIFRYIVEEEEEPETEKTQQTAISNGEQEPVPTVTETTMPETLTSSHDAAAIEDSAKQVDQALESKLIHPNPSEKEPAPPGAVNGVSTPAEAEMTHAEEAPVAATMPEEEPATEEQPEVQAQVPEPEKPKAPEPTPAVSPVKEKAQPAATPSPAPAKESAPAPSKPSAPKSWASLAAAAHRVTPAVPAPQQSGSPAPQAGKTNQAPAAAPAAKEAPSAAPATAPAAAAPHDDSPAKQDDEWTSVGDKKQQSKSQAAAPAQDGPQNRAYIKNVHEGIDTKDLRAMLEKFGELAYFDVSRQKNCAFVDFKSPEAYKAAIEANPHEIGNDHVVVEERRLKPGNLPFAPRGGARGGGRGGQGQGRGAFQGRGGFAGRGRGGPGGPTARGRGGAQAA